MPGSDNRIHARIHVAADVQVSTPDGRFDAALKDLSKGGARLLAPRSLGEVGDEIEVHLPSLDGGEVPVRAEIIRSDERLDGWAVAVRFDAVAPEMQNQLLELVEVLLSTSSGGGQRKHPRVARRVEIRFAQLDDLRGILQDITAGGLLTTLPQPLALYEEVEVTVPDLDGEQLLILHARVVHQQAVDKDGQTAYQVGFEFVRLRPETRRLLELLLQSVVESLGQA
jgi:c-di-GMP-binding flagellar brake protein YcgR